MEYEMEDEDRLFDESTNPSLNPRENSLFGSIWRRNGGDTDCYRNSALLQTGELIPDEGQQLS